MNGLWVVFKGLLSAALLALVGLMLWTGFVLESFNYRLLAFGGVLLFFVALLWIDWERPGAALPLIGVFIGIVFAVASVDTMMGGTAFPQTCGGRRRTLFCDIENLLYWVGGAPLAGAPFFVLAVGLLGFSLRALWRKLTAFRPYG